MQGLREPEERAPSRDRVELGFPTRRPEGGQGHPIPSASSQAPKTSASHGSCRNGASRDTCRTLLVRAKSTY